MNEGETGTQLLGRKLRPAVHCGPEGRSFKPSSILYSLRSDRFETYLKKDSDIIKKSTLTKSGKFILRFGSILEFENQTLVFRYLVLWTN